MLEVREEIIEGKEEAFINCHSLLHQFLSFSPESISALIHYLKQKENTKEEEEELHYSTLKKRKP